MIKAIPSVSVLVISAGALLITAQASAAQAPPPPTVINRAPPPAASPLPAADNDRPARARANYEALLSGNLSVGDLSAQDLQDVIDFERLLRGDTVDSRSPEQACVEREVRRAGGRPSQLAQQVIALKCRRIGGGVSR